MLGFGCMNPQVLLELVAKWEAKSQNPDCENVDSEASIENAVNRGYRSALKDCANQLNLLIKLLAR